MGVQMVTKFRVIMLNCYHVFKVLDVEALFHFDCITEPDSLMHLYHL